MNLTPQEFCTLHRPCEKGETFALQFRSMREVWDKCPRIDWLLWIYARTGKPADDRALRLFAVWCARSVSHLLIDPRSLAAIEVAERYANGLATREELAAASASGESAAEAAWSAASAARASGESAAEAAWSAASAARAVAEAAAQCAQFRELIPNHFQPPVDQLLTK